MTMTPKQKFHSLTAYKAIQMLKNRHMEAYYTETKEDAVKKALELMEDGGSVSWGGSQTLIEIGLLDTLKGMDKFEILDRTQFSNEQERMELQTKISFCDYFLMSSNAVSLDGKLINIDGNGDRLARLIYGPKNVIVIVGKNKLCTDEEEGIVRARSISAPLNGIRLRSETPCATTGLCHRCHTDNCICTNIVVTRMSRIPGRIKVIIVGESLGY